MLGETLLKCQVSKTSNEIVEISWNDSTHFYEVINLSLIILINN
jgi:hypothetical protein